MKEHPTSRQPGTNLTRRRALALGALGAGIPLLGGTLSGCSRSQDGAAGLGEADLKVE